MGKLLGAPHRVVGCFAVVGDKMRIDALAGTLRVDTRVVEVGTGVVRASVGESGKTSDFMGIETRLAYKLTTELAKPVGPKAAPKLLAAYELVTITPVAAYGRALDARDGGDKVTEKKVTEKKELSAALKASPRSCHAKADWIRLTVAQ